MEHRCIVQTCTNPRDRKYSATICVAHKSWHTYWIRDLQLLPGLPLVYQVYSVSSRPHRSERSDPPHLGALLRLLWRGARQHADIALDHLPKAGNSIGSDWWIIYYKCAMSDSGYVKLLEGQPPGFINSVVDPPNWSTRSVNPRVKVEGKQFGLELDWKSEIARNCSWVYKTVSVGQAMSGHSISVPADGSIKNPLVI